MFDPLDHMPDLDPDANSRAVPLSGKPLLGLLLGNWKHGAIGQSEYWQAWMLVWLALGPVLLLGGVLYLTGVLDPVLTVAKVALLLIAALFAVVTANLGAKRARGKGLPGWLGSLTSLASWALVPLMHSSAAPFIALGPAVAGHAIDRIAKKRRVQSPD